MNAGQKVLTVEGWGCHDGEGTKPATPLANGTSQF